MRRKKNPKEKWTKSVQRIKSPQTFKRMLTLLRIQIKHYIEMPVFIRLVKIKKINTLCYHSCEEISIFMHCWWECKMILSYRGEHLTTTGAFYPLIRISLLAVKPPLPIYLQRYNICTLLTATAWKQPKAHQ